MAGIPFLLHRRWIFLAFLVALHLVFMQGPETALGRLLFLSHIGVGLLWQPFVQSRRRVGFGGTALVICAAALSSYFLNWGFLIVWTMLLSGVVGGKVFLFPGRSERLFHLLALGYLTTVVLALLLPQSLAAMELADPVLADLVLYLSPAVFLVMALLPVERATLEERTEIVDYVYGVLVFLMVAVIVLGSLSFALLFKVGYFESLLMTLGLVAGILLLLGLIWDPRAGFAGLGTAVAQHVMSLGLPVEDWLKSLADLTRYEEDPERFLALACNELPERLPGVVGGSWEGVAAHDTFGEQHGYRVRFEHGRLKLELVTRFEPSPSLVWHYDLVVRLLAEFYVGKWRAEELKRLSYIEAIHETGARLTHDVKNLLQSLETLCKTAEEEGQTPSPHFGELLRRQLPTIAARLRQTVAKLSAPGETAAAAPMPALEWLAALESRYPGDWLACVAEGEPAQSVLGDAAMFSSIAENLLQNIIDKRRTNPALRAELRLHAAEDGVRMEVKDDGPALPEAIASRLFAHRIASENGFGIGLYQSARLAEQGGYRLTLAENRDGCVRFRLAPAL